MHIMTKYGWRALVRPCIPPTPDDQVKADIKQSPYRGPLPSLEVLAFIKWQGREHQEWLDRRNNLFT